MVWKLLAHYGFGEGIAVNPDVPIDNSDIVFQPLPFILAISAIPNMWFFAILSPLKFRPLMFQMQALTVNQGEDRDAMDDVGNAGIRFELLTRARGWLRAFTIAMALVAGMCVGLNVAVLSWPAVENWGFRDHFRRFPGAAVAAVGWVVCLVLLGVHILVVCVYESMRNRSEVSTFGVHLAGMILFISSLCAHASTIPGEEEGYGWFMGSEAFQIALAVWIGLQIRLAYIRRDGDPSPNPAAICHDTVIGIGCIACILLSVGFGLQGRGDITVDSLWMLLLFLWSFFDARNIGLSCTNIHVATDRESWDALQTKSFPFVPFFTADCHGIKEDLRKGADDEQQSLKDNVEDEQAS